MATVKIILADDHQLFLEGVKTVLEEIAGVEILATAGNGKQLLELVHQSTAGMVLLDLNMPEMDGLKSLKIIKEQYSSIKVLVLTNYNQPELMEEVRKLGADGFLVKDSTASELKKAVITVAEGGKHFPVLAETQRPAENSYFFDDFLRKFKLTRREVDIIRLVCQEYSSKQIADILNVSEFTVSTHRKNVQRKLNVKNVAGLVAFAKEHQLVN